MKSEWYVLATSQVGSILLMRLVAGPLSLQAATSEAQNRVTLSRADFRFSVVEFDSMFGLGRSLTTGERDG